MSCARSTESLVLGCCSRSRDPCVSHASLSAQRPSHRSWRGCIKFSHLLWLKEGSRGGMHIATGTGDFIYVNIFHKKPENPMTLLHHCSRCLLGSCKRFLEVSRALKQREQHFTCRGEWKLHLACLDFFSFRIVVSSA